MPCIAANDQPASLSHESRRVTHVAADHDVGPLHRDAATAGGVPLDDDQSAMRRRPALCDAQPRTRIVPDMAFSPTPQPTLPCTVIEAS